VSRCNYEYPKVSRSEEGGGGGGRRRYLQYASIYENCVRILFYYCFCIVLIFLYLGNEGVYLTKIVFSTNRGNIRLKL